jgi:Emfourin
MKVTLATHGGLAAGINMQVPPRVVDTETLPRPAAAELSRLVTAAKAVNASPSSAGQARDAMSYMITVEERGQSTTLAQSDVTMSAQFAALLNWLQQHAA